MAGVKSLRPLVHSVLILAMTAVGILSANGLQACPFCLSPPMTLVQEIATSDVVLIVELLKFEVIRSGTTQIPLSTVRIREFMQGAEFSTKCDQLQVGQAIAVRQEIAGSPGDLFLLFGSLPTSDSAPRSTFANETNVARKGPESDNKIVTADLKIRDDVRRNIQRSSFIVPEFITWNSTTPVSNEAIRYLKAAPAQSRPQVQRLPFYISFLENPDPLLSIDAWAEFANSTYEDVKLVKSQFPREKLREWIADSNMSPERLGLYGMMLGLCGDEDDADFLQLQIGPVVPTGKDEFKFFRYGTDGLMGGYLLLTGEKGLEFLEQTRLRDEVPAENIFAAVQAMQFIWSYENALIPQSRMKASMRRLLANDEMRILTIMNLARWNDWECWPELEQLFENEQIADHATRRAIVEFAEECRKATIADSSRLEIASAADNFLKQAEREHPELFRGVNNADFRAE